MMNQRVHFLKSNVVSEQKLFRSSASIWSGEQLDLFQSIAHYRMLFISISEITAHQFADALEMNSPALLLDTRLYPDFFSVFPSISAAFREFERRAVCYKRVPVQTEEGAAKIWHQLREFQLCVGEHLEKEAESPIFVLAGTLKHRDEMLRRVRRLLAEAVDSVKFNFDVTSYP